MLCDQPQAPRCAVPSGGVQGLPGETPRGWGPGEVQAGIELKRRRDLQLFPSHCRGVGPYLVSCPGTQASTIGSPGSQASGLRAVSHPGSRVPGAQTAGRGTPRGPSRRLVVSPFYADIPLAPSLWRADCCEELEKRMLSPLGRAPMWLCLRKRLEPPGRALPAPQGM